MSVSASIDIETWRNNIRSTTFANYSIEMGLAIDRAGSLPDAIAHYRGAVGHDPADPTCWYLLIDALERSGQTEEARAVGTQALALHPNSSQDGFLLAALRFLASGNLNAASRLAGRSHPAHAAALGSLSAVFTAGAAETLPESRIAELGRHQSAFADACERILALIPQEGRVKDQAVLTENILHLSPERVEFALTAARLYRKTGDAIRAAELLYPHWEALRDRHANLSGELATYLLEAGRVPEALRVAEEAVSHHPESVSSLFTRGLVLMACDRLEEALRDLSAAATRPDSFPSVPLYKAIVLQELGRTEEAIAIYGTLLQASQDRRFNVWVQGYAALAHGDPGSAAAVFRSGLDMAPDDVWYMVDLTHALSLCGERQQALDLLRSVRSLDPARFEFIARTIPWHRRTTVGLWRALDAAGQPTGPDASHT